MSPFTMPSTASMMVAFWITEVERARGLRARGLEALAVAHRLAGAGAQLVAVGGEVTLDLGQQLGVAQADQVAGGGAVGGGVVAA